MASVDQRANSVPSCTPVVSIVTLPVTSTKNSQPSNAINTGCLVTNPALVTTPTSQPVLISAPARANAAPSRGLIISDPTIAGAKLVVTSNSPSSTSGGQALVALSPGAIGSPAVAIVTSPNVGPSLTAISAADWTAKLKEIQTAERLAKLREEEQAARNSLDRRTVFELCVVCGDKASGRHYGAISCEGCKGFFKRSIRKQLGYACRGNKDCEVTKHHRNRCQYCRLQKCMVMGMRSDSVQSERKPLDSKERSSIGITASTQKIYIRKDLRSPLAATPTFVGDRVPTDGDVLEKALGLIDAGLIANSAAASNTVVESDSLHSPFSSFFSEDLSTLASVVTTLATMGKKGDLEAAADLRMAMNGEALASSGKENSLISKAFDTMARAVQSQSPMIHEGSTAPEHITLNMDCENESLFEIEGPLLMDSHIPFNLTTPTPMPSYLNLHFICESASRLLFLSVHWARSIPAFQLLNPEVQVTLVRGCWSELFTLGLAQCSQVMSLPTILTAIISHLQTSVQQEKMAAQRIKQVSDHICKLQDYVNIMLRLQVDEHEYAYLKAIMLFSPDHPSLPGARQVEKFQDKAYQDLRNYIIQTFPDNTDRFPKLLLRLPTLRSLQPSIMEELFFTGLIGNVQIDSVIPYILRMETSDYTGHMGGGQLSGVGSSNEAVDMTTSTTSSASQPNGQEVGSFSPSHSGSLKLIKQET